MSHHRRVVVATSAVIAALVLASLLPAQPPPDPSAMDDEQFLDFLESAQSEAAEPGVARVQGRLARLMFSIGATLSSGKANVRLLQGAMRVREPASESVREMVAARYEDYSDAVDRFRTDVSQYLDGPDSVQRLYRTLIDGHKVCWRLDAYSRLVETYGITSNDLLSILSSREACAQFRRAAFSNVVDGMIASSIARSERDREEIRLLEAEISDLERLVEDLREIERR